MIESGLNVREEGDEGDEQSPKVDENETDTPTLAPSKLETRQHSRQTPSNLLAQNLQLPQTTNPRQQPTPQQILSGGGTFGAQNTSQTPSNNQNQLDKYINQGKTRIYDMLQMLDIYGIKRKAEDAKKELIKKFPESDFAK